MGAWDTMKSAMARKGQVYGEIVRLDIEPKGAGGGFGIRMEVDDVTVIRRHYTFSFTWLKSWNEILFPAFEETGLAELVNADKAVGTYALFDRIETLDLDGPKWGAQTDKETGEIALDDDGKPRSRTVLKPVKIFKNEYECRAAAEGGNGNTAPAPAPAMTKLPALKKANGATAPAPRATATVILTASPVEMWQESSGDAAIFAAMFDAEYGELAKDVVIDALRNVYHTFQLSSEQLSAIINHSAVTGDFTEEDITAIQDDNIPF